MSQITKNFQAFFPLTLSAIFIKFSPIKLTKIETFGSESLTRDINNGRRTKGGHP